MQPDSVGGGEGNILELQAPIAWVLEYLAFGEEYKKTVYHVRVPSGNS